MAQARRTDDHAHLAVRRATDAYPISTSDCEAANAEQTPAHGQRMPPQTYKTNRNTASMSDNNHINKHQLSICATTKTLTQICLRSRPPIKPTRAHSAHSLPALFILGLALRSGRLPRLGPARRRHPCLIVLLCLLGLLANIHLSSFTKLQARLNVNGPHRVSLKLISNQIWSFS